MSPVLREEQIKHAFEMVLGKYSKAENVFSEELWRELVEFVTIYTDGRMEFHLTDGTSTLITLKI